MSISVPYDRSSIPDYLKSHRAGLSKYELEILSEAYGGREKSGVLHYEPASPSMTLRVGGSLARVSLGVSGRGSGRPPDRVEGDITRFSEGSRRRLMRLIASTDRDARPIFVTLTLPDKFSESSEDWKRYIDVFGKRFRRMYPLAGFVWRMEFKARRSGEFAGRVAPHYHLLIWGVDLLGFRDWVSTAWYQVVGSGSADHLAAGVQSQRIRRWGGTMSYVSKYVAKTDEYPDGWSGRVWGVVGRECLPWAVEIVLELPWRTAVMATRLFRKLMKLRGKTLVYGVSIIINVERVLDWLEWVEDVW